MDTLTREKRSWNMSHIRSKNTLPEKRVRSFLHSAGYRFRLHKKNLPGSPDIVLPKYQAAIFVHGCFWHRHVDCLNATMPKTRTELWVSKFKATVERDRRNTEALQAAGWRVIIVWECEVENDPRAVLQKICKELEGEKDAS